MRTVEGLIRKYRLKLRRIEKKVRELVLSPGKILMPGNRCLRLTRKHTQKHIFIAGGSGMGKTKMMEKLKRQLILAGEGLTSLDPHSDPTRADLEFCTANNIDPSRVVHLKPDTKITFSIDPLADLPMGGSIIDMQAGVEKIADTLADAFLRNSDAASQDMMKRLKHQFRDLVWLAAVPVNGKRLGLSDLQALTSPDILRPVLEHAGPVLEKYAPIIYGELKRLCETKSDALRDKWIESTTNLLSGAMGVHMQLILGQHSEPLRPVDLIRQRKFVFIDVGQEGTSGLSRASANVTGGMMLNLMIAAARSLPEHERVDHYFFIDEAENFIGEDLRMGFAEMRKFRLYFCIAFQDLSCLRKGNLDLVERVISICCVWFIFCQQDPENIKYLGEALKFASLDMTPLIIDSTLPDGFDWVDTQSLNISLSRSQGDSISRSMTGSHSTSRQRSTSLSVQEAVSRALSETQSEGESESDSEGESNATSDSWQNARALSQTEGNTYSHGTTQTQGESKGQGNSASASAGVSSSPSSNGYSFNQNEGRARSENEARSRSEGVSSSAALSNSATVSNTKSEGGSETTTESRTRTRGKNRARSRGLTLGRNAGLGQTVGASLGETEGLSLGIAKARTTTRAASVGMSFQKVPLPRHRFIKVPNGKTVVAVADQFYAVMRDLARLPERTVLVKVKGMDSPFMMEVHEVKDPYVVAGQSPRSKAWREYEVAEYLKKVYEAPFYFKPTDEEHMGRIKRFLGTAPKAARPLPAADENSPIA